MGDCLYAVVEGEVDLIRRVKEQEFCLATVRKGEFFGEGALLSIEVRLVTARAGGEATVMGLEKMA